MLEAAKLQAKAKVLWMNLDRRTDRVRTLALEILRQGIEPHEAKACFIHI